MKTKIIMVGLVGAILSLYSCKKDLAQSTQTNMAQKNDSVVSNPMAHAMDSATVESKKAAVKNGNITLDKDAITLNSVTEGSTEKAYLVFNDDQSKAEIFLPNQKIGSILERKGTEGSYTWTDGNIELIQWKGYLLRTLKEGNNLFAGDVQP